MEAQATTPLPRLATASSDKRPNGRLDKAHQATYDAKEMAKLVAHYFELRLDKQKEAGRGAESLPVDQSGMWAISHLVELTTRADTAVDEAMR